MPGEAQYQPGPHLQHRSLQETSILHIQKQKLLSEGLALIIGPRIGKCGVNLGLALTCHMHGKSIIGIKVKF